MKRGESGFTGRAGVKGKRSVNGQSLLVDPLEARKMVR
jgi:hypothetical protein